MNRRLSLPEVEHVAFRLAQEHLAFDEPIPAFRSRLPGTLESCLSVPFQTFDGKALYGSLVAKASILFYLLIKNHPFQNGNKRIALTTMLVFLAANGKWLAAGPRDVHGLAVWVAQSVAGDKDFVVMAIEAFIRKNLVPVSPSSGAASAPGSPQ